MSKKIVHQIDCEITDLHWNPTTFRRFAPRCAWRAMSVAALVAATLSSSNSPVVGSPSRHDGKAQLRAVPTPSPGVPGGETASPEKYRPSAMLKARDDYERTHGYHFNKIERGNKGKKLLALTFDDGPHAGYTEQLLDILKKYHTRVTFFPIGKQVDKYPNLVRLEVTAGHEIGNHTYDHVDLTQIPPELIGFELDECDRAIKRATGYPARFFRPPGGNYDINVVREATRRSYITALWTDDPGDYAKPGSDVVLQRTLDRLENGAIILLHDGIPETMSILPAFISEARKRGYEFVTMSELARER